jgi:dimethylglycine dehydrogenase
MLNEFGKLIGDFTIAKVAEEDFMVWGSSAAQRYHMRWFEKHLPKDGPSAIHRYRPQTWSGCRSPDPAPATYLKSSPTTTSPMVRSASWISAGWMSAVRPAWWAAITYTGDLGYEIWMEPCYQLAVYRAIKAAGEEFGIADFGMRALFSMRLEKNFPTWFRELRPIYGPYEAGMDRFIKLSKNDFIGREAAAKEHTDGPKLMRTSFLVDALDADVMGDEPVWARVGDTDYGTVEAAPRLRRTAL